MTVQNLPTEEATAEPDCERRTVDLEEDSGIVEALATTTARRIATVVHESPRTASEVAARAEISLQTVCYHIDRLRAVGLIKSVGARYSSKGREMEIYALTSAPIVLQFGDE